MIKKKILVYFKILFFISLNFGQITVCDARTRYTTRHEQYALQRGVLPTPHFLVVDIRSQTLTHYLQNRVLKTYRISTSKRGPGQTARSFQTPRGLHQISEKIGHHVPHYGVFKGRVFTGYVWPKSTPRHQHRRDHIVTRIFRLEGLEPGFNKGRNRWGQSVDTLSRGVYIHGTTMEWKLGRPASIGCIHMGSQDIVRLFNSVPAGTLVMVI